MASCTFNEPDYWHHWFVMAINPAMPRFIHCQRPIPFSDTVGRVENPFPVK
jgi:hypothetical protein